MSLTPFTFLAPTAPASYAWEATDEEVAARYGLAIERRRPLRPQHVADATGRSSPACSPTGASRRPSPNTRPPTIDASPTPPPRDSASATDEILVGAGADEVLDIIGKVFLPLGSKAVVPIPTYAMYRVITEQRGATVVPVPRLGAAEGYRLDATGGPGSRTRRRARLAVQPQQPDRTARTRRRDRGAPRRAGRGRRRGGSDGPDRRPRRGLRRVRRPVAAWTCAPPIRGSSSSGPPSKAYALAGLRVGFGLARPEVIAELNPFRSPASVSTVSLTLVTAALRRTTERRPGTSSA